MSKRKLLLADDSVTIQKVVNLTFADEGIEVISFGDGDTAMAQMFEISPDLIMADVNMPGLNGYQICEQIRQDAGLSKTPVILLVGSFEPFDEDEARRVGADDFLTKPFQSIRQLVNKVTDLLNPEAVENGESAGIAEPGTFVDTLEIDKTEEVEEIPNYLDAGVDDEMIQTSQATFALDESQKFATRAEIQAEDDFSKTQPLTNEEIKEFDLVGSPAEKAFAAHASEAEEIQYVSEETATETDADEPVEFVTHQEEDIPLPEVASILESDDDDLLELPPIELDYEDDYEDDFETEPAVSQTAVILPQNVTEINHLGQISPELIDVIVQRVIEKLSDKAIKEVAWEVVPQMAELIVKRMAEENLKK